MILTGNGYMPRLTVKGLNSYDHKDGMRGLLWANLSPLLSPPASQLKLAG